jgi:hypothetical protein
MVLLLFWLAYAGGAIAWLWPRLSGLGRATDAIWALLMLRHNLFMSDLFFGSSTSHGS